MEYHVCRNCGGPLKKKGDQYHCPFCRATYEDDAEQRACVVLEALLNEAKSEEYAAAKRALYEATHAKYPSGEAVLDAARKVLSIEDKDPLANVYVFSHDPNPYRLNAYLPALSVTHAEAEEIVRWLLPSLQSRSTPALLHFVQHNFRDEELTRCLGEVEEAARRVDEGVYETGMLRDVFVAYSSADAEQAIHIVDLLEENGLSCFLSLRNLRHGQGAAENYLKRIEEAMASCRVFLFLSSPNSLTPNCDAVRVELPHLVNALPKKPRIQYILSDCDRVPFIVTRTLKTAFPTQSHCRTEEDLITRVADLVASSEVDEESERARLEKERVEQERVRVEQERARQAEQAEAERRRIAAEKRKLQRQRLEEERRRLEQDRERAEQERLRLERERERLSARNPSLPPAPPGMENWPALGDPGIDGLYVLEDTTLVKYVGDGLQMLRIPRGITAIAENAFFMKSERHILLPDTVTEIAPGAFCSPRIESVESVPSNPSFFSVNGALYSKDMATLVFVPRKREGTYDIPDSVTTIAKMAFYYCASLTEIILPKRLKTIGALAFCGCKKLGAIAFPEGLREIGEKAFRECESIRSFRIPSSVVHIGNCAFGRCPSCTEFAVDPANAGYLSRDGILFDAAMGRLLAYPAAKEGRAYSVPETVSSLDDNAFSYSRQLQKVRLPKTLTRIPDHCFYGCLSLTSVKIPKSVRSIGEGAFGRCWARWFYLDVPATVREIGKQCFSGVEGRIALWARMSTYSKDAFDGFRGRIDEY